MFKINVISRETLKLNKKQDTIIKRNKRCLKRCVLLYSYYYLKFLKINQGRWS